MLTSPASLRSVIRRQADVTESLNRLGARLKGAGPKGRYGGQLNERDQAALMGMVEEAVQEVEEQFSACFSVEEEGVMASLLGSGQEVSTVVAALVREHRELGLLGLEMLSCTAAWRLARTVVDRRKKFLRLGALARSCDNIWRRHLAKERQILFPLAQKILQEVKS